MYSMNSAPISPRAEMIDRMVSDFGMKRATAARAGSFLWRTGRIHHVLREAVEWLQDRYRLTRGEAEATGQRLLELGALHHVLDEHGFVDGNFFYRFRADEVPR